MNSPSSQQPAERPPERSLTGFEAFEARFDDVRRRVGLILAPLLFLAVLVVGIPGLTAPANRLAAILLAVIVLWMTEAVPLPVTALLGPTVAVMLGIGPVRAVFAPFADPLIFLFIGSFILAQAIFVHGLNERIAFGVMSWEKIGARPGRLLLAYGIVTAALSMWISNTAATAMMLPIGLSLLAFMEREGGVRKSYGAALMLLTSYAATWGGVITPVGTPPNLIGLGMIERYTGERIDFVQWMMLGAPLAVVVMFLILVYLLRTGNAGVREIPGSDRIIRSRKEALGPWKRGERNALITFGVTVALWILPGVTPLFIGREHAFSQALASLIPESVAALAGAVLLFLLPLSPKQGATITWKQAANIDWGTILLFGGGLSLGELTFSTGLAESFGRGITGLFPLSSLTALTFASALFALVLSETMSNTAATNIVLPIVISIALAAGVDPVIPALSATFAASAGFALPVSTPPNALVYGTGKVSILQMARYGVALDVVTVLLIPAILLLLAPFVLG